MSKSRRLAVASRNGLEVTVTEERVGREILVMLAVDDLACAIVGRFDQRAVDLFRLGVECHT